MSGDHNAVMDLNYFNKYVFRIEFQSILCAVRLCLLRCLNDLYCLYLQNAKHSIIITWTTINNKIGIRAFFGIRCWIRRFKIDAQFNRYIEIARIQKCSWTTTTGFERKPHQPNWIWSTYWGETGKFPSTTVMRITLFMIFLIRLDIRWRHWRFHMVSPIQLMPFRCKLFVRWRLYKNLISATTN